MLKLFNAEHEDVLERKPIKLKCRRPNEFRLGVDACDDVFTEHALEMLSGTDIELTTRDDEQEVLFCVRRTIDLNRAVPQHLTDSPSLHHSLADSPHLHEDLGPAIADEDPIREKAHLGLDENVAAIRMDQRFHRGSTRDTSLNFMFTDEVQP